eukprot:663509-Prorocentrum_lima.AAC.1
MKLAHMPDFHVDTFLVHGVVRKVDKTGVWYVKFWAEGCDEKGIWINGEQGTMPNIIFKVQQDEMRNCFKPPEGTYLEWWMDK